MELGEGVMLVPNPRWGPKAEFRYWFFELPLAVARFIVRVLASLLRGRRPDARTLWNILLGEADFRAGRWYEVVVRGP